MEEKTSDIGTSKADESEAREPSSKAEEKKPILEETEDVPDPDEDDLDDLDDMLDDFSTVKLNSQKPEAASGPGRPGAAPAAQESKAEDASADDEFIRQLNLGMENLIKGLEKPEMQAQFESAFKEIQESSLAGDEVGSASAEGGLDLPQSAEGLGDADTSFQGTIRRTMERMRASGDQASAAAAAEGTDDFMNEFLKQMQEGGLDGEGSEEDFSKMLLGMMEQLTNKEILYDPMKELNTKFPEWLESNRDKTPAEDLKRYEEQQSLVNEIVAKFEEPTYSDSNVADREYIADRMQKMQAAGSPPSDLVGDMPSAQEALGAPDESCTPQ